MRQLHFPPLLTRRGIFFSALILFVIAVPALFTKGDSQNEPPHPVRTLRTLREATGFPWRFESGYRFDLGKRTGPYLEHGPLRVYFKDLMTPDALSHVLNSSSMFQTPLAENDSLVLWGLPWHPGLDDTNRKTLKVDTVIECLALREFEKENRSSARELVMSLQPNSEDQSKPPSAWMQFTYNHGRWPGNYEQPKIVLTVFLDTGWLCYHRRNLYTGNEESASLQRRLQREELDAIRAFGRSSVPLALRSDGNDREAPGNMGRVYWHSPELVAEFPLFADLNSEVAALHALLADCDPQFWGPENAWRSETNYPAPTSGWRLRKNSKANWKLNVPAPEIIDPTSLTDLRFQIGDRTLYQLDNLIRFDWFDSWGRPIPMLLEFREKSAPPRYWTPRLAPPGSDATAINEALSKSDPLIEIPSPSVYSMVDFDGDGSAEHAFGLPHSAQTQPIRSLLSLTLNARAVGEQNSESTPLSQSNAPAKAEAGIYSHLSIENPVTTILSWDAKEGWETLFSKPTWTPDDAWGAYRWENWRTYEIYADVYPIQDGKGAPVETRKPWQILARIHYPGGADAPIELSWYSSNTLDERPRELVELAVLVKENDGGRAFQSIPIEPPISIPAGQAPWMQLQDELRSLLEGVR